MPAVQFSQDFVTAERLAFAAKLADQFAAENRDLSAADAAEKAVRKIFGRWLLDFRASVHLPLIPLYYRLINEVEQRIGLHRRRGRPRRPEQPALARAVAEAAPQASHAGMRSAH